MNDRIPFRLGKEPLLEAVWEVRFAAGEPYTLESLHGEIYKALSEKYPKTVRLPAADIPASVSEQDANLRYAPKIRLERKNHAIQIGDRMVSLNCRRPYPGWNAFSSDIGSLVSVIRDSRLVGRIERFSLRYADLLEFDSPPSLSWLNLEIRLAGESQTWPVQMWMNIQEGSLSHLIRIVCPAMVTTPEDPNKHAGVLLDIDTFRVLHDGEAWSEIQQGLEEAHSASKQKFFKLLTPETIQRLEPKYEAKDT